MHISGRRRAPHYMLRHPLLTYWALGWRYTGTSAALSSGQRAWGTHTAVAGNQVTINADAGRGVTSVASRMHLLAPLSG